MVRHRRQLARFLALWLAACPAGADLRAQAVAPELLRPENRTESSSKQFIAFGGTRKERSDLVRRAEELKAAVLGELRAPDAWQAPVLFILTPGDGARLRSAGVVLQVFDAGDAGKKLQLDIAPGLRSEPRVLDDHIVSAVLLEWSLRRQKFQGQRFAYPPDWLVAALSALAADREAAKDAALYAGLLGTKSMPRPAKFLQQKIASLRGAARELHAAQSVALFESLADLPGGRTRIVANLMLTEPVSDPVERFAQTWPELAGDFTKLARLWALGVARLASPQRTELLPAIDTAMKLADILGALGTEEAGKGTAAGMLELARTEEGRFTLRQAQRDIQRLGFRAHPLYAPVIEEYRVMLEDLASKRRRGFQRRFEETEDLRLALDGRSGEITDYMNWFQANREDAVAPAAAVRRPVLLDPPPARNDAISRFMAGLEQRGW